MPEQGFFQNCQFHAEFLEKVVLSSRNFEGAKSLKNNELFLCSATFFCNSFVTEGALPPETTHQRGQNIAMEDTALCVLLFLLSFLVELSHPIS